MDDVDIMNQRAFADYVVEMCKSNMKIRGRSLPDVKQINGFVEGTMWVFFHEDPDVRIVLYPGDDFFFDDCTLETIERIPYAHEPGPYPPYVKMICDAIERAEKQKSE